MLKYENPKIQISGSPYTEFRKRVFAGVAVYMVLYKLGFSTNRYGSGCAIAQAVSRWLPTSAARVWAWVWSCGICGGQSGAGAGFLRVLWFPLPVFIPPIAPQSFSSIIWGLYSRPEVAAVPSGVSPTPPKKEIGMAENQNCLTTFNDSLLYQILWKSLFNT
jgi:hypothetical protein